ncbi:MAG: GMP/IMP nucleotidase [Gammaproteobacteria bacterium]|nr:GMP/IMP nucleotidase [Gammaproteobacteria bacterium]MDH5304038.1 GMP/IMP nucleotidase [Gammaproteobacteria bacterium]MDH5321683.1 GMP/IMP nucleotidase [Gammaproteobacteria bacterium]
MSFDPKTALRSCDTLMLDMDGTILDLAYDNYMWLTYVPQRWAEQNGMSFEDARSHLIKQFGAAEGDLRWYCLDHWSEHLGLDVAQLHRDNHERIGFLPGAFEFLQRVRESNVRLLLVTNSHQATLDLKDEVTGLTAYFDGIYTSHSFGFAKERQEFWHALRGSVDFDPERTMFIDDSLFVLRSAASYGVRHPVAIARPDTSRPRRENSDFVSVDGLSELL